MRSRDAVRVLFVALVVASSFVVASGYLSADTAGSEAGRPAFDAGARDDVTVIATDSNTWLGESAEGPRARAELVAFAPNGSVLYYDDSHTRYWDVDPVDPDLSPVGNESTTVLSVAADHLPASECGGSGEACTRNVVERVNLSTGEVNRLYARITPGKHSTRWHDVDRVSEDRLAVADIARDRVFVVNTTTELVEWSWDARSHFPLESGGPYPEDWTHINDVEVIDDSPRFDDGTLMVSVRNHDQVVFLDPETGVIENMTLGEDGDHDTLYEQHNPDYIPESQGGPAVLIGDSENDRVVEYQRTNASDGSGGSDGGDGEWRTSGEWERSWVWSDARAQWPRDADRLPNGHTLITDSNGNRVVEVNEAGEIVWQVDVAFPYESERLGTGDESTGGPSAASADLQSQSGGATGDGSASGDGGEAGGPGEAEARDSADSEDGLAVESGVTGALERAWQVVESLLPGRTANALMYVTPVWMAGPELLALGVLVLTLLLWLAAEAYWSSWTASVRSPVSLSRRK
ncbi:arylsulfotransferase family protein [Halorussus litoreus]|uniref:arylsulfotransferase family protein n=1 Tax=Halorussus litoreus TaxID=1710536 RepID=UPI000E247EDD|nr:arylsulfotransferase family protein [Halorussus litoreus]